ncbi:hypothetical protein RB6475 [Rhodopirellula baltica SH 1]|uniref:Uncharacterized protein n=1 Tax=Rhodopirellula baltica (strain DSM 10527 / NCIMB 13988 / SH1) TaxID=243090 RepID=Q7UQ80_RHOBA|nr:hypothetical protein RB6475 [Rhodopirellula baltica SH 1]
MHHLTRPPENHPPHVGKVNGTRRKSYWSIVPNLKSPRIRRPKKGLSPLPNTENTGKRTGGHLWFWCPPEQSH